MVGLMRNGRILAESNPETLVQKHDERVKTRLGPVYTCGFYRSFCVHLVIVLPQVFQLGSEPTPLQNYRRRLSKLQ